MVFKSVLGQNKAIEILRHDIKSCKIAHAYLFNGPEGVGKRKTAYLFAKSIACKDDGCQKCEVCSGFETHHHSDLKIIRPQGSFIGIEKIRKLEQWVAYKAIQSQRKVAIIEDTEKLTDEAANALLKTLEEPQEDTSFICLTSNKDALLKTVISRCRQVNFRRIVSGDLVRYLSDEGYPKEKTQLAVNLGQGIFAKSLLLLENDELWVLRENTIRCLNAVFSTKPEQINKIVESFLGIVDKYNKSVCGEDSRILSSDSKEIKAIKKRKLKAKERENLFIAIDFWWLYLRDLAVYEQTNNFEAILNIDYFDEINKSCQNSEVHSSWYLACEIPKLKRMIKQNVNVELALETMLLKAAYENLTIIIN